MTQERDVRDTNGHDDSLVSQRYRELAGERVPASLNESILREARAVGGRGYAHSVRWLRPLAWAATVGLCLAVVIELSQAPVPAPSRDVAGALTDELEKRRLDAEQRIASKLQDSASFDEVASLPVSAPQPSAEALSETAEDLPAATASMADAAVSTNELAAANVAPAEQPAPSSGTADADPEPLAEIAVTAGRQRASDAAVMDDMAARQQAAAAAARELDRPENSGTSGLEEVIVTGSRLDTATESAASDASETAYREERSLLQGRLASIAEPACDESQRSTAERWHACIEALEDAGLDAAAEEERRAFEAEYPDFEPPEK